MSNTFNPVPLDALMTDEEVNALPGTAAPGAPAGREASQVALRSSLDAASREAERTMRKRWRQGARLEMKRMLYLEWMHLGQLPVAYHNSN